MLEIRSRAHLNEVSQIQHPSRLSIESVHGVPVPTLILALEAFQEEDLKGCYLYLTITTSAKVERFLEALRLLCSCT